MLAQLKISSRILIVFIGLLLITLSSGLIYLHSTVQFAPNAFNLNDSERHFYFNELESIKVSRGFWNIEVIPSDSNFLVIKGGVNLLNNFLISDQTDTGINLSLSDSIMDDHLYHFKAELYTNSLVNIHLGSFANMFIDSTHFDKLIIILKDKSILQMKDCEIFKLNFALYNASVLESETCTIGNVSSSMYDTSFAFIYSAENIVYNIQKGYSVLMSYDNENCRANVSDSLVQLSSINQELIDNIKLLMPFQKPLMLSENEIGELDSITYKFMYYYKPVLSPEPDFYYYQNWQYIDYESELLIKGIKTGVSLGYTRGLLKRVSFSFDDISNDDSLYSLMKNLKERFDISESSFTDSSYYKYDNNDITEIFEGFVKDSSNYKYDDNEIINLSYDSDEASPNIYEFMIWRKGIPENYSIYMEASYSLRRGFSFWSDKYLYYHTSFLRYHYWF